MLYDTLWRPPYGKSEQSLRGGIPPPNALYIIIIYMPAALRAATETGESHKKGSADISSGRAFRWRRKRDLNPRTSFPVYSLSRGAPSTSWVFLH